MQYENFGSLTVETEAASQHTTTAHIDYTDVSRETIAGTVTKRSRARRRNYFRW